MKRILIRPLAHRYQRYDTVGDYQSAHGYTVISVSELGNDLYEQLVAVHELVEYVLVTARGISLDAIDKFDIEYESTRSENDVGEPGDDVRAPYHAEHAFASRIERLLAEELQIDWNIYDQTVAGLHQ